MTAVEAAVLVMERETVIMSCAKSGSCSMRAPICRPMPPWRRAEKPGLSKTWCRHDPTGGWGPLKRLIYRTSTGPSVCCPASGRPAMRRATGSALSTGAVSAAARTWGSSTCFSMPVDRCSRSCRLDLSPPLKKTADALDIVQSFALTMQTIARYMRTIAEGRTSCIWQNCRPARATSSTIRRR